MCNNLATKIKGVAVKIVKVIAACLGKLLFAALCIFSLVSTALWWPPCSPILFISHHPNHAKQKWHFGASDEAGNHLVYANTDNNAENTGIAVLAIKAAGRYYYSVAAIASVAQPFDSSQPFITVSFDNAQPQEMRVNIDRNPRILVLADIYDSDIYNVSKITFVYHSTTGEDVSTTVDLSGLKAQFDQLLK